MPQAMNGVFDFAHSHAIGQSILIEFMHRILVLLSNGVLSFNWNRKKCFPSSSSSFIFSSLLPNDLNTYMDKCMPHPTIV